MAANVQQPQIPQVPAGEPANKKQTWAEYGREVYNEQYERWMPWIEDFYLRWFTKDNKASYATKGTCPGYPCKNPTWSARAFLWGEPDK